MAAFLICLFLVPILSFSQTERDAFTSREGCCRFHTGRVRPHLDGSLSELSRGLRKKLAIAQKETVLSVAPIGKPMTKTQGK